MAKEKKEEAQQEQQPETEIELKSPLQELKEQHDELNDKYLRLLAEFDNYKKRTAKEREDLFTFSTAQTVRALLPVIDSLEMAKKANEENESVKDGLELVLKQFDDCLSSLGIEEITCESFDPELHNAVMHEEDESMGEKTITDVFQKGYKLKDKVIRHAMVKVVN